MKKLRILFYPLQFLLGALFIFSGMAKLFPVEPFEFKLVEAGFASWSVAPFIARIIIAAEIYLGFALIIGLLVKQHLRIVLWMLVAFTLYLLYDYLILKNTGNCGCFGSFIEFTPLQAIAKNVVMLAVAWVLLKYGHYQMPWGFNKVVVASLAVVSLAGVVIINHPFSPDTTPESFNKDNFIPLLPEVKGRNGEIINLQKGRYVLAFFSVGCGHCKNAAYKLAIMEKKEQTPPVLNFFFGEEKRVTRFRKETRSDFPYAMLNNTTMFQITEGRFPTIYVIENGRVVKKLTNKSLTTENLNN